MNEQFTLPDGTIVGTGLLLPTSVPETFPVYEDTQPMYTRDELKAMAVNSKGRERFGQEYVKNQRSHGSCNGFAGARALTKARVRRGLPPVHLSGAYLYSLINGGRDRGSMLDDGMQALMQYGCCREELADWDQIYPNRYNREQANADAAENKAIACYVLRTEEMVFSAAASGYDLVIAVHADNGFMKLDSRGVAQGGNGPGNHSVSADGYTYDSANDEFLLDHENSWGLTYGQNGRSYLTWKQHLRNTVNYHQFYAIRSASDPKGKNPPVK